jgi:hypothetical protein
LVWCRVAPPSAGTNRLRVRFAVLSAILLVVASDAPAIAGPWLPAERVHPDTPFYEYAPDIAVGPDGRPVIVWETGDIWWVQWIPESESWSPPALVHQPNARVDEYPRVSIGSDGTIWVVWSQDVGQTWALLSSRHDGGSWTVPDTVLTLSGSNDVYDVLALTAEDAWVVSDGRTPATGSQKVILVRHYEGGTWVERGLLSAKLADGHRDDIPYPAMDASGVFWVTWQHHAPEGPRPYVARFAGGWSTPEALPLAGYTPQLATLDSGPVIAVWVAYEEPFDLDIAYVWWEDGDWGATGLISEPDGPNDLDGVPSVGSSGDLGPLVVWMAGPYFSPSSRDIMHSDWRDSAWSPEEVISNPDSTGFAVDERPQVAVSADGTAWACWTRLGPWAENQDQDVWFSRGQVYPPSTFVGEEATSSNGVGKFLRASPNPITGFATLEFQVPRAGQYEAVIYDVAGQLIDRVPLGRLSAGTQTDKDAFRWPSRRAIQPRSGVYFISVRETTTRENVASGRLVLLR